MTHDVVSIGNPLMDVLIEIEEEFLKELDLVKGNMHLIDEKGIRQIEKKLKNFEKKRSPGGSEANILALLSMLGHKVVYFGKVGKDDYGKHYHEQLQKSGVLSKVIQVDGMTGRAITLITPDCERTFATSLGVCNLLKDSEISEIDIVGAKYLHLTGYILDSELTRKAAIRALNIAHSNNVKVCLDLADINVIKRHKDLIISLAKDYVNIIIANDKEAKEFTGLDPEKAINVFSALAEIAIIKLGEKGSIIQSKGELIRVPGFKAKVVDTTGAGDAYTAGFLYGLLNDLSLKVSGLIASFIASKVVEVKGARIDRIPIKDIEKLKLNVD